MPRRQYIGVDPDEGTPMRRPAPRRLASITVVASLALASCSSPGSHSTIECRLVVASDANADTASIPFEAGELELAVAEVEASVVVTFGDLRGSIRVDVYETGTTDGNDPEWIGTAMAGFDRTAEPLAQLIQIEGGASGGAYSVDCWTP